MPGLRSRHRNIRHCTWNVDVTKRGSCCMAWQERGKDGAIFCQKKLEQVSLSVHESTRPLRTEKAENTGVDNAKCCPEGSSFSRLLDSVFMRDDGAGAVNIGYT